MAKLERLKDQLTALEERRERNVNRYILPIESKIAQVREKIEQLKTNQDERE